MSIAEHAPRIALAAAALTLVARSLSRPPLRPLAASLAALTALDLARAAGPGRSADVALCAAWWPILTLAVALGLCSGGSDRKC